MAICRFDLDDHVGAADALRTAEQADPAKAKLDAEFLMAGGLLEDREVPALRLLASAVERDPSLARARYEHARLHERLLRKREVFEPAVANAVNEEYASVLAIDPANVSAWANRAYVAWLLSSADPGEELDSSETPSWRRRAVSSLKAGREYKDVRAETMVVTGLEPGAGGRRGGSLLPRLFPLPAGGVGDDREAGPGVRRLFHQRRERGPGRAIRRVRAAGHDSRRGRDRGRRGQARPADQVSPGVALNDCAMAHFNTPTAPEGGAG